MYKRDYFLRLVEQLTAVTTQAMRLGNAQDYREAMSTTDEALRQLTGLGTAAWLSMDTGDILANLSLRDELGGEETAVFLIGVFCQEGELYALQGDADRADYRFLRALQLQLAILESYPDMPIPDIVPAVPALRQRVADLLLPPETSRALIHYYETEGRYGEAEDILFEWIEAEPGSSEAIETGAALYQRLLQTDDGTLAAGGLPRAEVEAGLAELLDDA